VSRAFPSSSGNRATFKAIRRASSFVNRECDLLAPAPSRSRVPDRLAPPMRSAPCSSASRTNRWLFDLWVHRIRDHDHTSASASCALFVVRSLLRLFGVHGRLPGCNSSANDRMSQCDLAHTHVVRSTVQLHRPFRTRNAYWLPAILTAPAFRRGFSLQRGP
jgi:hypothetical protein